MSAEFLFYLILFPLGAILAISTYLKFNGSAAGQNPRCDRIVNFVINLTKYHGSLKYKLRIQKANCLYGGNMFLPFR